MTKSNVLSEYNKKEHVNISESGRVTEAEVFMTVPTSSVVSCCTSCFWSSTSWTVYGQNGCSPSESLGTGRFPKKKHLPPEGLRCKEQAHTCIVMPRRREKPG